jgi:uncharacterized protein
MSQDFVANRLDIKAFAKAAGSLSGRHLLSKYERLMRETKGQGGDRALEWQAHGELRVGGSGFQQIWLHLQASVILPLICQRCLGPADIEVSVDRSFRFVATEEQAEAEDEEAEEDVLALHRDFNLMELIEDELIMAMPVVPRHEVCPTEVKLAVQDPDFEAESGAKPNPFAVLAKLQTGKSS